MRPRPPFLIAMAAISAAAALGPAAALRADLAQSSPFLARNQPGSAQAGGPTEPVELRGIMSTADGIAVCIYDTAKKTGTWVGLNEPGYDFLVRSADASGDSATVRYQGRDIKLTLRSAKVASSGTGQAAIAGSPDALSPAVLNPTPGDEQKRLDAVAAEVHRRRQERERAAQAPGAPGAAPPASPNR